MSLTTPSADLTLKMPQPPPAKVPYDSGDIKQVKRQQQKVQSKEERLTNAFINLMASPDGRLVFGWLLEQTGPYRSSFATNALQMAYQEGLRKLGLILTDRMAAADPKAWVAMQLEIINPTEG